jgi:hypothetical protein
MLIKYGEYVVDIVEPAVSRARARTTCAVDPPPPRRSRLNSVLTAQVVPARALMSTQTLGAGVEASGTVEWGE